MNLAHFVVMAVGGGIGYWLFSSEKSNTQRSTKDGRSPAASVASDVTEPIEFVAAPFNGGRSDLEPSYQPAPLTEYSWAHRQLAQDIFQRACSELGSEQVKAYKGSYSFFFKNDKSTAAKIIIFEVGRGKANGNWPELAGGVYVLVRVSGRIAGETIGVAPKHSERFTYFRASEETVETAVETIVAAANHQRL